MLVLLTFDELDGKAISFRNVHCISNPSASSRAGASQAKAEGAATRGFLVRSLRGRSLQLEAARAPSHLLAAGGGGQTCLMEIGGRAATALRKRREEMKP